MSIFILKKATANGCDDFDKKYPTFNQFVKNNGIKCCFYAHDFPQIDFVLNANQNKLTNFVGRCEDMQYDFDYVCGKIGITKLNYPEINKTQTLHKILR